MINLVFHAWRSGVLNVARYSLGIIEVCVIGAEPRLRIDA